MSTSGIYLGYVYTFCFLLFQTKTINFEHKKKRFSTISCCLKLIQSQSADIEQCQLLIYTAFKQLLIISVNY